MALSVVNVTRLQNSAGGSVSGAIADMGAGALMVTVVSAYGNGTSAGANHQVSDSEQTSSAYSTVVSRNAVNTSSNVSLSIHYHGNTVAGSGSSGNASGGANTTAIVAIYYEVGGANTTTPFVAGESTGSSGNSSLPDSGDIINSVADSIIIAGMGDQDGTNPILYGINKVGTVGTYTENTSSGRQLNGGSFPGMGTVYQIVSAGSSQRHTWQSTNGAGARWATVMAAFGAAAAGGGGVTTIFPKRTLMGVGR